MPAAQPYFEIGERFWKKPKNWQDFLEGIRWAARGDIPVQASGPSERFRKLKLEGRMWTAEALGAWVRERVKKHDEHVLVEPFERDFVGREEPDIYEVLECARPYLPREGAFGEMVLNVGKAVYLARKGAAGIIDISPFTCMNGIVCEAIYPRISRDHGGIPIRNFYFDGTQSDLDRDLGVYMELARSYRKSHSAVA